MADFSTPGLKIYVIRTQVKYVDSPNAVTLRLPDRKKTYHQPTSSDHFPATCRCRESQQLHARTKGCANYDLKDEMSPNYELSDTVHCLLGTILISKCKRGNFHTYIIQNETMIGKNFFLIAIVARKLRTTATLCMSHNKTYM